MAKHELSRAEWLNKAEAYCARAEHCAADVRRKLAEWCAPEEIAGFIEESLYKNGFLNDERFCHAYVHDKVNYQRWGRMKIEAGLRALQLPSAAICEALETIDETTYTANLRRLAADRRNDAPEKRIRFLMQRGFTYEEIKKCT